jgi:hypothetical protein
MSDLLTEIDEMMRQERMASLWKKHGMTIVTIVVAIIVGTGISTAYNAWKHSTDKQNTAHLLSIVESPQFPQNVDAENLDLPPALRGIALVTAASASLKEGDNARALTLYETAAQDTKVPENTRHLAALSAVRLEAAQEGSTVDVIEKLKPVLNSKNSPWLYQAHLEAALIYAHKAQDYAKAREHLNIIQDTQNLPDTLYEKAIALNHVYSLRQQQADQKTTTDEDS